jgi:hypothetical protein
VRGETLYISTEDFIHHGIREGIREQLGDIVPACYLIEIHPKPLCWDSIDIKESLIISARVRRTGSSETGIN